VSDLLDDADLYAAMSQRVAPYGTGNAAALIREDLVRRLVDQSASADRPRPEDVTEHRRAEHSLAGDRKVSAAPAS
jgi:hypothetical protein